MTRAEFPEVRLLAQSLNTWYCGGNNIGIDAAGAEAVLQLNPDTEVAPDALALMYRFLLDHPDYVGVTAQLVYPKGELQRTCARVPEFRQSAHGIQPPWDICCRRSNASSTAR